MDSLEKLNLKWNDFQQNITSTFESLREDIDFTDVTLACEDGKQVKAHKVILAASCSFFQNLLRKNIHPHPLIYMRGMKSDDLIAIVDFLYHGEVDIHQENVAGFLKIAEELKLKGLNEENSDEENSDKENSNDENSGEENSGEENSDEKIASKSQGNDMKPIISSNQNPSHVIDMKHISTHFAPDNIKTEPLSVLLEELKIKVKSIITIKHRDGQIIHSCNICGKEAISKNATYLKNHIEVTHIDGIFIPCNFCGKTFRSRHCWKSHARFCKQSVK